MNELEKIISEREEQKLLDIKNASFIARILYEEYRIVPYESAISKIYSYYLNEGDIHRPNLKNLFKMLKERYETIGPAVNKEGEGLISISFWVEPDLIYLTFTDSKDNLKYWTGKEGCKFIEVDDKRFELVCEVE